MAKKKIVQVGEAPAPISDALALSGAVEGVETASPVEPERDTFYDSENAENVAASMAESAPEPSPTDESEAAVDNGASLTIDPEPTPTDESEAAAEFALTHDIAPEPDAVDEYIASKMPAPEAAVEHALTHDMAPDPVFQTPSEEVIAKLETLAAPLGTIETLAAPLGTIENPIGLRNPEHRIFWHGRDINGREFIGSAPSGAEAVQDAMALGCATCHQAYNPAYVEAILNPTPPAPAASTIKEAKEQNAFYVAGFEDGQAQADSQYQDLKALVQAWATIQAMDGADLDQEPMVVYIRHH